MKAKMLLGMMFSFPFMVLLLCPNTGYSSARRPPVMRPQITSQQADCDFDEVSVASSSGVVKITSSVVTVNNGTTARECVLQFSTETWGSTDTTIAYLRYSVDGGACVTAGPNVLQWGTYRETITSIATLNLGAGVHNVSPCFSTNEQAWLGWRCLTVECRTK